MQELFQAAFSPPNIVFTTLLCLVMVYWLTVFLGLLDIGAMDIDIDADVDVDVDVDGDMSVGGLSGILFFFNFGRVPFMVVLSFLILSMWAISIVLNYYWGQGSLGVAALMLLPNLAVSLLITKVVTSPLVPVFKRLDGAEAPVDYIGQICTLTLSAGPGDMGQAEVLYNGTNLLISVMGDKEQMKKGEKGLIVQENKEKSYFIIQKIEN
jgi:hypothetical protein